MLPPKAVSSYLTISPLPVSDTGGIFSAALSVILVRDALLLGGEALYVVRTFLCFFIKENSDETAHPYAKVVKSKEKNRGEYIITSIIYFVNIFMEKIVFVNIL